MLIFLEGLPGTGKSTNDYSDKKVSLLQCFLPSIATGFTTSCQGDNTKKVGIYNVKDFERKNA
ncbi:hypothetical protein ACFVSW_18585 [Neobacillus sp. NPDC058068]|uniref:hypothetical protein n=1 Tax=Neobacillus sp. NPDC058068 TaxID=3346325 RepID=UPI0036D7E8B1